MNKLQEAHNVVYKVAEQQSSCIVMCSLGKDSLVTLDLVYPHFDRVVCVLMYFVKGLSHIDNWIRWVKKKYPQDLQKIYKAFPMSERILWEENYEQDNP